ncbi:hypothetical protein OPW32_15185 [Vibrio europaeus]|uniref:hypothetical protein n=1 Tax=Vibrio europaeus TaxID=300876 RepID=UPI00234217F1|nr:hypothetical protein [Vibrio europaeus]MDC5850547.1 hypothetical protein [Vibrio europaeus]
MRLLIFIAIVLFSLNAQASPSVCKKNFPYHFVTADGTLGLYQGTGGAWWYPCSISQEKNGVTTESCKAALSSYLSAKAQGKPITFSFMGSCDEINSSKSTTKGFLWFGVYW